MGQGRSKWLRLLPTGLMVISAIGGAAVLVAYFTTSPGGADPGEPVTLKSAVRQPVTPAGPTVVLPKTRAQLAESIKLATLPKVSPRGEIAAGIALAQLRPTWENAVRPAAAQTIDLILLPPSHIAAAHPNADPALVDWLRKWEQHTIAGRYIKDFVSPKLTAILEQSTLSAAELYQLAQAAGWTAADPLENQPRAQRYAEYPFVRRALEQAATEAESLARGSPEAKQLAALMQANEGSFWVLRDGPAMEKQSRLMLQLLDPPDQAMARISLSGALYMQRKYDDAMREISALAEDESMLLTPMERIEMQWMQGLVLYGLRRYEESLPFFETTASNEGYQHAADAMAMQIYAMVRTGRAGEAEEVFERLKPRKDETGLFAGVRGTIQRLPSNRGSASGATEEKFDQ